MSQISLYGLLLAAMVAVSVGELCTPDQWEAVEASMGGYYYHQHPGMIMEHNYVSYDATNRRKASFISYANNEYKNHFQMIVRYDDDNSDSGKVYVVDLNKNKCWTKKIVEPFRKACIPDDAKKIHNYFLGLEGDGGLSVTSYEVKVKEMGVFLTVSKSGKYVIPVLENIHGNFMKTSFIQGMEYGNVTPGIKNATVFDIPKQCEEKNDVSIPEYLMRKHFIMGF